GTSTAQVTYSDYLLSVANTNPIVAVSQGHVFFYTGMPVKLVAEEPNGTLLWELDYIGGQEEQYIITASVTAGTTNNNYVCNITPPFTAPLPNNLTLVMTPDTDSLATLGTETFTGSGINDLVWS